MGIPSEDTLAAPAEDTIAKAAEIVKAESRRKRQIAVIDKNGVLIGRVDSPDDETWSKAVAHLRFENGFDNPFKLYRLAEWKPGRWRFEPIKHKSEHGKENHADGGALSTVDFARMIFSIHRKGNVSLDDASKLADFLQTMDGQG